MKTKVFCFILILIGAFTFSSCTDYGPEGPVTIEIIDNNCFILKQAPFDTIANVIFLEEIQSAYSTSFFWKRKVDSEYKTISLTWVNNHSLNSGCAYFIMDTINLPSLYMKFIDYRRQGVGGVYASDEKLCHKQLIDAYLNPGKEQLIKGETSHIFSKKFWTADIQTTNIDSIVKYDKATKKFYAFKLEPKVKISKNYVPLISLVLFFLITLVIVFKKIKDEDWKRKDWKRDPIDGMRLIYFLLGPLTLSTIFYNLCFLRETDWFLSLLFAALFSIFSELFFSLRTSCVISERYKAKINGIFWIALIGSIQLFFFKGFSIWLMFLFGAILSLPMPLVIPKSVYQKLWENVVEKVEKISTKRLFKKKG